jgi:hypothetical protein
MICKACKDAADSGMYGRALHKEAGCKAIELDDPMMCDCQHRSPPTTFIQKEVLEAMKPRV